MATSDDVYEINTDPVGLCLIINNKTFRTKTFAERSGSESDVELLTSLFRDHLHFEVTEEQNLTANEILQALTRHADKAGARPYSMLAVVIMSHGHDNDAFFGTDGQYVTRVEIMKPFTAACCPAMRGKPKLFIVNSCRGTLEDIDAERTLSEYAQDGPHSQHDSNVGHNAVPTRDLVPNRDPIQRDSMRVSQSADMCFVYSCSPGYVSYRHFQTGSVFISKFKEFIERYAATEVYTEILRRLLTEFNATEVTDRKMMPEYMSTLTKNLYLREMTVYDRAYIKRPDGVYKMDSQPRGSCLIINNRQFEHLSLRKGSEKDMENLRKLFEEHLHFEVTCVENQPVKEMLELLKKHAQKASSDTCALAVVIMSHGGRNDGNDIVYGTDGKETGEKKPVYGTYIEEPELLQCFTRTNCPAMAGKPKLFIIQACRGSGEDVPNRANGAGRLPNDSGEAAAYDDDEDDDDDDGDDEADGILEEDAPRGSETADTHTVFSSSPGYTAYRYSNTGSVFVKTYIEYVKKLAGWKEYDSIIKEIRMHFNNSKLRWGKKTMPSSKSILLKDLYLNPVVVSRAVVMD